MKTKPPNEMTVTELIVWLHDFDAALRSKLPAAYEVGHERGVGMVLIVRAMHEFLSGQLDVDEPPENREAISQATALMHLIWREVQEDMARRYEEQRIAGSN